ncbi:unnamed protein product, partial [Iphiclides podalirius]
MAARGFRGEKGGKAGGRQQNTRAGVGITIAIELRAGYKPIVTGLEVRFDSLIRRQSSTSACGFLRVHAIIGLIACAQGAKRRARANKVLIRTVPRVDHRCDGRGSRNAGKKRTTEF